MRKRQKKVKKTKKHNKTNEETFLTKRFAVKQTKNARQKKKSIANHEDDSDLQVKHSPENENDFDTSEKDIMAADRDPDLVKVLDRGRGRF